MRDFLTCLSIICVAAPIVITISSIRPDRYGNAKFTLPCEDLVILSGGISGLLLLEITK